MRVVAVDLAWPPDAGLDDGVNRVAGDVTDDATWSATVAAADAMGGASMLVINAAKLVVGTVLDVPLDDVRAVMEVNVFAAVKALKATLPGMIARGGGRVVGVASTASPTHVGITTRILRGRSTPRRITRHASRFTFQVIFPTSFTSFPSV